jgi:hypothetical protein
VIALDLQLPIPGWTALECALLALVVLVVTFFCLRWANSVDEKYVETGKALQRITADHPRLVDEKIKELRADVVTRDLFNERTTNQDRVLVELKSDSKQQTAILTEIQKQLASQARELRESRYPKPGGG